MKTLLQIKLFLKVFLLSLIINSCGFLHSSEVEPIQTSESGNIANSDFVIAFGSCNRQNFPQPLWNYILKNNPDVFIWGGDNIYADTDDMEELESFYRLQRANEDYSKLVSSTKILATWDDHDYGKNDAGRDFEHKQESQQKFLDFIDVPVDDVRRRREGIYYSELYETKNSQVKIIVLDTRYFRSPLKLSDNPSKRYSADGEGTILGQQQWQWLEKELGTSKAQFNIIGSSIQFISAEHGFETWANFPGEVEKLQKLLVSSKAKNVVILSGDRHISEFSKVNIPGLNYPLIDFTSSGLTHSYTSFSGEPNKYRKGKVINDLSYGLLFIDFKNSSITMQMRGEGNVLQQEVVQTYK